MKKNDKTLLFDANFVYQFVDDFQFGARFVIKQCKTYLKFWCGVEDGKLQVCIKHEIEIR